MSDAHSAVLALSASACPASTRPASRRPVRVQRPPVRCPRVRCPCPVSVSGVQSPNPTSSVRCPVRASGIRSCRVRVRSVRIGAFVEREGAAGSHTPRDRPGRRLIPPSAGQSVHGGSPPRQTACRSAGAGCRMRRSRPESLGRGSSALGGPFGRQRGPTAAQGGKAVHQQQSGREGKPGLTSENRGGPAGICIWDYLIRDNRALILISRNVDNSLLSWAFRPRSDRC
jgi:hypothetical protein